MDFQTTEAMKTRAPKRRSEALKLLLMAGLSVQAWGILMGLSLMVLNFTQH
ncbi:hypothetical protein [Asticcacaulis sp. EMRT-3]|uniref:hypothetical protein n=1 Tax=Asticcacaulis sp. EMRT-3 TaxID=3040349 RepID=UPI0024AF2E43|nr:hypothetical protein [Asticcacaulis sp. EMRT-3]MDI7774920.1 hypothetical protein [Asticcacaulis sp. EMRT-3]